MCLIKDSIKKKILGEWKNFYLSFNFANKSRYSKIFSSVIPRPKMLSLPIIILVAVIKATEGREVLPSLSPALFFNLIMVVKVLFNCLYGMTM